MPVSDNIVIAHENFVDTELATYTGDITDNPDFFSSMGMDQATADAKYAIGDVLIGWSLHGNGIEEPTLPVSNLLDPKLSKITRFTLGSPGAAGKLVLEFKVPMPISLLCIPKHNLHSETRWIINGTTSGYNNYTSQDYTDILGTTELGWITATPGSTETFEILPDSLYDWHIYEGGAEGADLLLQSIEDPSVIIDVSLTTFDYYHKVAVGDISGITGTYTQGSYYVRVVNRRPSVWPPISLFGVGYWGAYNWGGYLNFLTLGREYKPPAVWYMPLYGGTLNPGTELQSTTISEPVVSKTWEIIFYCHQDQTSIDLGRLIMSPAWQPTYNIPYNWTIEFVDPSESTRSRGGQVYVDLRPKYRKVNFELQYLDRDEMLGNAYEIDRMLGIGKPMVVIIDPTDPVNLHRLTIYGSQTNTSAITHKMYKSYFKNIELQEWV